MGGHRSFNWIPLLFTLMEHYVCVCVYDWPAIKISSLTYNSLKECNFPNDCPKPILMLYECICIYIYVHINVSWFIWFYANTYCIYICMIIDQLRNLFSKILFNIMHNCTCTYHLQYPMPQNSKSLSDICMVSQKFFFCENHWTERKFFENSYYISVQISGS